MKKLPCLLAFSFFTFLNIGFSQIEFEFEEEAAADPILLDEQQSTSFSISQADENMAKGIRPALVLIIESADDKLVEKVWKDFMKDYDGKTKRAKGGNGEDLTSGAEIVGINGVNLLDIYSKAVSGSAGNTEFFVWFDLGGDEFLESNRPNQYAEAERLLLKFAHEVKIEMTRIELNDAEKKLRSLDSDLSRLERQNEGYHRDIEQAEKRIEEAKQNIVKNEEQKVDTSKKIELQKLLVEEIDRRLGEMRKQ